jgi:CRP/FNR family transcriptional regulator
MGSMQTIDAIRSSNVYLMARAPVVPDDGRFDGLPGTVRVLHRGEHLFRVGDPVEALYLVRAGSVKRYLVNDGGDDRVLGFSRAGDVAGLDSLLSGVASDNAEALDTVSVRAVAFAAVFARCREDESFHRALLAAMSREMARLTRRLCLEGCTAEQRLAAFLVEQSEFQQGRGCSATEFRLAMSRRDVGRYLDLATETVSRVFTRLQGQGLLCVDRGSVVLNDLGAIRSLARTGGDAAACGAA